MFPTIIPSMTLLVLGVLLSALFAICSYKSDGDKASWFGTGAFAVFLGTIIAFYNILKMSIGS